MTGILEQLKWESLKKGRKDNRLILLYKVLKVKPVYQQMTISPKLGTVGISTLWHFRLPLPIQMFIKIASSPRLSGIGMPSPILWSHPLKMQMIVLLSSLLWWELGTNSLITGPGEWLSFRRFTSKLSWSWSWCWRADFETLIHNGDLIFALVRLHHELILYKSHYCDWENKFDSNIIQKKKDNIVTTFSKGPFWSGRRH